MERSLNRFIDHTLLRPDARREEIKLLCEEAERYQFASVCIHPLWVQYARECVKDPAVKICGVAGFPCGASTTKIKTAEVRQLVEMGADEIDMVIHVGALKSNELKIVREDIAAVVKAAPLVIIKVILETCLLTDDEKKIACKICVEEGAHFVKTSTGFSKGGATVHDVELMRNAVGPAFGVKAAGGIRDYATALKMIEAGATRLGTSAGVVIADHLSVVRNFVQDDPELSKGAQSPY